MSALRPLPADDGEDVCEALCDRMQAGRGCWEGCWDKPHAAASVLHRKVAASSSLSHNDRVQRLLSF